MTFKQTICCSEHRIENKRITYVSRIIRRRNHGLVKLYNQYEKEIYNTFWNKKEIEGAIEDIYQRGSTGQVQLEDFSGYRVNIVNKIEKLKKKLPNIMLAILMHGGSRVMNIKGKTLKLPQPKYDDVVNVLVADNLSYVGNLLEDQREELLNSITKGIQEGWDFNQISNYAIERTEGLTKNRSMVISRTESTRAHGIGMKNTMIHNDINEYRWVSAKDDRVAPLDRALNGKVFKFNQTGTISIRDEKGKVYIIPASPMPSTDTHPNCRCVIVANL